MEITCPNCGQTCEVDEEPAQGQHLLCPFCDVKFNYTSQNTTENDSNSIANTAEPNAEMPPAKIQTTCPHCGAVYEVDAAYIGETVTCGMCGKAFVITASQETQSPDASADAAAEKAAQTAPGATNGHIASKSGRIRINTLRTKAKTVANAAKGIAILTLKAVANEARTKAIPAFKTAANAATSKWNGSKERRKALYEKVKSAAIAAKRKTQTAWQSGRKGTFIISGIAAFLVICLAVTLLSNSNQDTDVEVSTGTNTETVSRRVKEAACHLEKYIETPTDRRFQVLSQSLKRCPEDFKNAVNNYLQSLKKTYDDVISAKEQDDAMAGTILFSLLAGAACDNPIDGMTAGARIGRAIGDEMQQTAQRRLKEMKDYSKADLIDIAQKYGVDLREL